MIKNEYHFGVHDFYYHSLNQWSSVFHFHEDNNIFRLGRTDNGDCWGESIALRCSNFELTEDYESFRYGGRIYADSKPSDFEKPEITDRSEVEAYINLYDGIMDET
jgi:hypothetical protein